LAGHGGADNGLMGTGGMSRVLGKPIAPARPGDLRAILFDLDGTLLDSFESHLAIYRSTLAAFGIDLSAAAFREHYSPDWNDFYRRVGLAVEHWDAASVSWLREASAHRPRPFPGVVATLRRLRARFQLGLVTSGSRSRVEADLERCGIVSFLAVIVTADDVKKPKPAPEGLHTALRSLGIPARQALYVGDTEPDYEFARAAGVEFVGVASGFSRPRTEEPYVQLAAVTDLPAFLETG
jgi:AHBA synthesis associated protein